MGKIRVITGNDEPELKSDVLGDSDGGALAGLGGESRLTEMDTQVLRKALADFSGEIGEALRDIRAVGEFRLKEVQISVEISAEGGISLIGSAKAGAKGAVNLTFSI